VPEGIVRLIKFGPVGSTATFSISATGGTLPLGSTVTLDACAHDDPLCRPVVVWRGTDAAIESITISETDFTGDLILERINVISDYDGTYNVFWPTDPTVTVHASNAHNATVRFKNIGEPPEELGTAGCTPGFWKNSTGSWPAGYLPGADFDATFGVNGFNPNISLLAALNLGGGGKNALARHAVAALLNSVHSGVDYGLSSAEVIALVQSAFASGDFESAKNRLAGLNEADCVLPNDNSFKT
jgi:hypothetical protein